MHTETIQKLGNDDLGNIVCWWADAVADVAKNRDELTDEEREAWDALTELAIESTKRLRGRI